MKIPDIMVQLERVRVKCGQDPEAVVLELNEEWKWQDLADACQEACDILFDYEQAAAQSARMTERYETAKAVIDRGMDTWQCPECMKFISYGNEYCHWCGQRLDWDTLNRKRGGRKCRKR